MVDGGCRCRIRCVRCVFDSVDHIAQSWVRLQLFDRGRPLLVRRQLLFVTDRLAEVGITPSVGTVGDSYDNALAETVNNAYKAELIRRRGPWKTVEQVELATLEWVYWYNNQRLHESLGYVPPTEHEASMTGASHPSETAVPALATT